MVAARQNSVLQKFKRTLRRLVLPAGLILVFLWTAAQLFSGERGLFTWHSLRQQVADMQAENAMLQQKVAELERQVERLSDKTMDLDYVEEQIRRELPKVRPEEEIIYLKE